MDVLPVPYEFIILYGYHWVYRNLFILFPIYALCRPDTRRIFVDIGLGFHVEFTWSEALEFISVREARLAR